MAKTQQNTGIILRTHHSGADDIIVHIMVKNGTIISCLAKGARKPSSKKGGNIELGNIVRFKIVLGYAIAVLSEIQIMKQTSLVLNTLEQKIVIQTLCEMFYLVCKDSDSDKIIYDLLLGGVARIQNMQPIKILAIITLKLLDLLGFIPSLQVDSYNGNKLNNNSSIFIAQNHIGYTQIQENSSGQVVDLRIIKSQLYIVTQALENLFRLSLAPEEWVYMLKLHIKWFEEVTGITLKSSSILFSILT